MALAAVHSKTNVFIADFIERRILAAEEMLTLKIVALYYSKILGEGRRVLVQDAEIQEGSRFLLSMDDQFGMKLSFLQENVRKGDYIAFFCHIGCVFLRMSCCSVVL